jgi:beta-lactamase regulating signal transducer with metallopeptidase domain
MAAIFFYSFKVSLCLGVLYLFYLLALRNLTYFTWNRWYFLLGTGLSFLIPLVDVVPLLGRQQANPLLHFLPILQNLSGAVLQAPEMPASFWQYAFRFLPILFGIGAVGQGINLLLQLGSIARLRRSATRLQHETVTIYQVDRPIAPFSFGSAIFLNQNLLQPPEMQEIVRHELVHVRQRHTLDMLWIEALILVNWYNPFVWLLKRAVRQNLEFIADREVLQTQEGDKKHYQYLLLKVIGLSDFTIANQFNLSSLKSRIIMMNRTPSNRRELTKFLFVLPLMALLILAFQGKARTFPVLPLSETSMAQVIQDTIPPPPPPPAPTPPPPPPPPPVPEEAGATCDGSWTLCLGKLFGAES